jgi:hypothetical protein
VMPVRVGLVEVAALIGRRAENGDLHGVPPISG